MPGDWSTEQIQIEGIDQTTMLNHALVRASEDHEPEAWMLFLHGILGSGANWRTIAKRFIAARPRWGAVLVDLRMHGSSLGEVPPHTVARAANDLVALESHVPGPIRGVLGHSFGGKVALQWASEEGERLELERVFLIDSNPGARPDARGSEGTIRVVEMLESLPATFPTRQAFVDEVQRRGHDLAITQWLAMNLERQGDHTLRFGLDMTAIRALLEDYFTRDLWSVVENPPGNARVVVINGGRSNVFDAADRARVEAIAVKNDRVHFHIVPRATHWVHADAPDALHELLVSEST
jgi:pimeloyl-ACP methyl ester carboxylesterase